MKDFTEIIIILDRSGSMELIRQDAIGGFNTFLQDQQELPGGANITLAEFNYAFHVVYEAVPLHVAVPLTMATYRPMGGTALLDAIGETVTRTGERLAALSEAERPDKVLVVIITDGEENSSRIYTRQQVFDMISHQQDVYNWQFVFIGANQDAIATGAGIGIRAMNTMSFDASDEGYAAMTKSLSEAAASYRVGCSDPAKGYFAGAKATGL